MNRHSESCVFWSGMPDPECDCGADVMLHRDVAQLRAENVRLREALALQASTHDQGHSPCCCAEARVALSSTPRPPPTHRCKLCGALWTLNPADPRRYPPPHPFSEETWSLHSSTCGKCCDNEPMGEQIERLPSTPESATHPRATHTARLTWPKDKTYTAEQVREALTRAGNLEGPMRLDAAKFWSAIENAGGTPTQQAAARPPAGQPGAKQGPGNGEVARTHTDAPDAKPWPFKGKEPFPPAGALEKEDGT